MLASQPSKKQHFSCSQPDLRIKSCATDPTYKYLECEQKQAYASSSDLQDNLDEHRKRIIPTEPDFYINAQGKNDNQATKDVDESVARLKRLIAEVPLPTCYEDPIAYLVILGHMSAIETARTELRLPLKHRPEFGSLPTEDINAYTFPKTEDHESLIAFNNELIRFALVVTSDAVATIELDPINGAYEPLTPMELNARFENNPDLSVNLQETILEFLHLPHRTFPSPDSGHYELITPLNTFIGRFAAGHEYGHVIKNHQSITGNVRIAERSDSTGKPVTMSVLVRSWGQELEADQLGTLLMIQVMKDTVRFVPESKEQFLYSLRGALLFFTCLQIIDEAKYIQHHGTLPPRLSDRQKEIVRAKAVRELTLDEEKLIANLELDNHPPPWFRFERVRALIDQADRQYGTPSQLAEARKADAIIDNAAALWAYSSASFAKRFSKDESR